MYLGINCIYAVKYSFHTNLYLYRKLFDLKSPLYILMLYARRKTKAQMRKKLTFRTRNILIEKFTF